MMRDMCWIFYEDEDTCNLIISQSDTIYTMMNREVFVDWVEGREMCNLVSEPSLRDEG